MADIKDIIAEILKFRDERDWEQFHDSKNLACAISIEAAELNELFLWKSAKESESVDREALSDEIADVLAYTLMLAHRHNFDIADIIKNKMKKNAIKYPIEKAKGSSKKYNELK
jgi:NTP pyrophosphatase (non-canonical NTP hydrolase)